MARHCVLGYLPKGDGVGTGPPSPFSESLHDSLFNLPRNLLVFGNCIRTDGCCTVREKIIHFMTHNDWLQLRIDMFIWFPVLVLA